MIKEAIEFLMKQGQAEEVISSDGESYFTRQVFLQPADPTVGYLDVTSLQSIIDYLEANRDELSLDSLSILVEGPDLVSLQGSIFGRHRQREVYMRAVAELPKMVYDRYVEREDMQIAMISRFAPIGDLEDAVKIVSTITSGTTRNVGDDGVQQEVTVSRGAATKSRDLVKRVYHLAPYRTFLEVEQPISPFVLRIKGDEEQISVGLFEADGGAWKIQARERIAGWLREALSNLSIDVKVFA